MKYIILIVAFAALTQAIPQKKENNKISCDLDNRCGKFPPFCKKSRYRSYDGSCNNLKNPQWGSAFSPYARFLNNSYFDGIHELPRSSSNKFLLNPRLISIIVFPDVFVLDLIWNVITLQWGQVVAHDMALTAKVLQTGAVRISCCTNGEPVPADTTYINSRCAPIPIPKDDQYNAPEGNTCINFLRTFSSRDLNCSLPGETAEPLSEVTSFHDLSIVYGNSEKEANKVRAFKKGKLAFVLRKGQQWLPQDPNVTLACNNVRNAQEPCYSAGDVRVNQNPHLALLQTILMREHNRIAKQLNIINPHWSDERCFQETRRINIAKAQHITYYEFIQTFLGTELIVDKGLTYPQSKGFVNDYNPHVNPQTLNEHSTAAYRNFHTQIVGQLKMYSENRHFTGKLRLSDWFNRPSIIEKDTCGLTRGLSTQPQNAVDRYFDSEITLYFFRAPDATLGQDMRAIDIQRSRDHGIGTYQEAREKCGLGKPMYFSDLEKYIKKKYVKLLMRVYEKVEDVELAVAGPLETHVNGTLAGPTFLCILLEQFYRTRVGDRYFYENGNMDGAFTLPQLKSLRKSSMSRLLCDNVKCVNSIQPKAFAKITEKNSLVRCNSLPEVDLSLWKEYTNNRKGAKKI